MQFLYLNFFWIAPSTSVALLLQRRYPEFRAATTGVIACFFIGYALYVAFPAAPPRLVLVAEFTKNLRGYPVGFSSLSAEAFSLLPTDSRAAFPSLHTAASTVALVYAWRFLRPWFWVLLPFVVGLWASTIYLRHHYFVDLVAGWALAPVAVWVAPRWTRGGRDGSGSSATLRRAGADEASPGHAPSYIGSQSGARHQSWPVPDRRADRRRRDGRGVSGARSEART